MSEQHSVSHAGYLSKKGHVVSNWKHRYFVIQGSTASYYKTQDVTQSAKGSFSLQGATIVKLKDDSKSKWFGFMVTIDSGKQFSLRSLDRKDREEWIKAMNDAGGRLSSHEANRTSDIEDIDQKDAEEIVAHNSSTAGKSHHPDDAIKQRKHKPKPPPSPAPLNDRARSYSGCSTVDGSEPTVTCTFLGMGMGSKKKNGESDMDAAYRARREEFKDKSVKSKDGRTHADPSKESLHHHPSSTTARKAGGRLRRASPDRKPKPNDTHQNSGMGTFRAPSPPRRGSSLPRSGSPARPLGSSLPRGTSPARPPTSTPPSASNRKTPNVPVDTPIETSSTSASIGGGGISLPPGWEKVEPTDGQPAYYYHKLARISRWEAPDEEVAALIDKRLREQQKLAEEHAEKRDQESKKHAAEASAHVDENEALRREAEEVVKVWAGRRPLSTLLKDLHVVYPFFIAAPLGQALSGGTLPLEVEDTSGEEGHKLVKKAFMKAALTLHPDKVTSQDPKVIAVAAALFAHLSAKYDKYKT